jgi:hypothetical protein
MNKGNFKVNRDIWKLQIASIKIPSSLTVYCTVSVFLLVQGRSPVSILKKMTIASDFYWLSRGGNKFKQVLRSPF